MILKTDISRKLTDTKEFIGGEFFSVECSIFPKGKEIMAEKVFSPALLTAESFFLPAALTIRFRMEQYSL